MLNSLKIALFEGINKRALEIFSRYKFKNITCTNQPLTASTKINSSSIDLVGIRSRSKIDKSLLEKSVRLLAVGCYCIGVDQIDLATATKQGVAVFNAPFSNTRSVAELVLGEIIALSRQIYAKCCQCHHGKWDKSSADCQEVRGKTLGIIGYGHIGGQLSILAESIGMKVIYYDIVDKLALGNAQPVGALGQLLKESDFVSLHVPQTPHTTGMLSKAAMAQMKKGSFLINSSRGSVVDIKALAYFLRSGHLAGAAIDVFPTEPKENGGKFSSPLQGLTNVILTPHIGGSTVEAQGKIAEEVTGKLIRYLLTGESSGSINMPQLELARAVNAIRLVNIHHNEPGVIRDISKIVAASGANITAQALSTNSEVGYLIMDIEGGKQIASRIHAQIGKLPASIKTRILLA